MRQNMEELQASQEEMQRKQNELEGSQSVMNLVINLVPFPIFLKDSKGKYAMVNKAQAELFGRDVEDFIGKSDDYFITNLEEGKLVKDTDKQIIDEQKTVKIPEQVVTLAGGRKCYLQTMKVPFFNSSTKEYNILGVSVDLTENKLKEEQIKDAMDEMKEMEAFMRERNQIAEEELNRIKERFNGKMKEFAAKNNITVSEEDLI